MTISQDFVLILQQRNPLFFKNLTKISAAKRLTQNVISVLFWARTSFIHTFWEYPRTRGMMNYFYLIGLMSILTTESYCCVWQLLNVAFCECMRVLTSFWPQPRSRPSVLFESEYPRTRGMMNYFYQNRANVYTYHRKLLLCLTAVECGVLTAVECGVLTAVKEEATLESCDDAWPWCLDARSMCKPRCLFKQSMSSEAGGRARIFCITL